MYVVLMVSDPKLAIEICAFNTGVRVRPVPNTYTGERANRSGLEWHEMESEQPYSRGQVHVSQKFPRAPYRPGIRFYLG
jgi:hypothetical protein